MAKKADLQYYGTGKRKSSIARVYVTAGTGKVVVNGHPVEEYMPYATLILDLKQPLTLTGTESKYDVRAEVKGGGFTGQAGAIRLGLARALLEAGPPFFLFIFSLIFTIHYCILLTLSKRQMGL